MSADHPYKVEYISSKLVIVFCTTHINPVSCLPLIEETLKEQNFSGPVIFDLLLSNGFSSNRFVQAEIKDGKIDGKSIKVIDESKLNSKIIEKINIFYKENINLLNENYILLDEEKEYLLCN